MSAAEMSKLQLLFFLLLVHNPCLDGLLQSGSSLWERSLGTSFSTAVSGSSSSSSSGGDLHMEVCISVGCCRHVCRQFIGDSSSAAVAPVSAVSQAEAGSVPADLVKDAAGRHPAPPIQRNLHQQVTIVPAFLEWPAQPLFSPSVKHLTICNNANDSTLEVYRPQGTDEFYIQGDESSSIAPGESLELPVVFLPQRLDAANGEILLKTSAGERSVQLRGQGSETPYRVSISPSAVQGDKLLQLVSLYNPHNETIQVDEIGRWPIDSAKSLSKTGASDVLCEIVPKKRKVGPGETAEVAVLELSEEEERCKGSLRLKLSTSDLHEVMILPLQLQQGRTDVSETVPKVLLEVRTSAGTPNLFGSGRKPHLADGTLKPLIREITALLLRQPDVIWPGSLLPVNQNQPTLLPAKKKALSFSTIQTRTKAKLWINLTNPSDNPVTIKLEIAPEVKRTDCKWSSAFWSVAIAKARVRGNDEVFELEEGSLIQATIQPRSNLAMGPVTFFPRLRCDWSGLLFIKNSYSGLEWIPLRGTAGSGILSFVNEGSVIHKLQLARSQADEADMSSEVACQRKISSTFMMKNTGNLKLRIQSVDMTKDVGFELAGVRADGYVLEPGDTAELTISHQPNFNAATTRSVLVLSTSTGDMKIPVVSTLPKQLISTCRDIPPHERLLLPISVCALVVVLGVFTKLLLREIYIQSPAAKHNKQPAAQQQVAKKRQLGLSKSFNLVAIWKSLAKRINQAFDVTQLRQERFVAVKLKSPEQENDKDKSSKLVKRRKKCRSPMQEPVSPRSVRSCSTLERNQETHALVDAPSSSKAAPASRKAAGICTSASPATNPRWSRSLSTTSVPRSACAGTSQSGAHFSSISSSSSNSSDSNSGPRWITCKDVTDVMQRNKIRGATQVPSTNSSSSSNTISMSSSSSSNSLTCSSPSSSSSSSPSSSSNNSSPSSRSRSSTPTRSSPASSPRWSPWLSQDVGYAAIPQSRTPSPVALRQSRTPSPSNSISGLNMVLASKRPTSPLAGRAPGSEIVSRPMTPVTPVSSFPSAWRAEADAEPASSLTSIGALRKAAAEVSIRTREPGEYDIWGDHFAVANSNSSNSSSSSSSSSNSRTMSLFSQSLPTGLHGSSCADDVAQAPLTSDLADTSYCYYPPCAFTESIYNAIVS